MSEKIVITGLGAVTSLGNNVNDYWDGISHGRCGIDFIKNIPCDDFETKIAAEVDNSFELLAEKCMNKRLKKRTTRCTRMGITAAHEAITDADIKFNETDCTRIAVILGISDTSNTDGSLSEPELHKIVKDDPSVCTSIISIKYGIKGASFNMSAACASSAYAMAVSAHLIESGLYDIVITGGISSGVREDIVKGFNNIMALSVNNNPSEACCPFSKNRDGFVIGEGAGIIVLESEKSALRRNAHIYCTLSGFSMLGEAYDMTSPQKDGKGMAESMKKALEKANISPDKIDYINAHGTSTNLNDKYETMAIKEVFGENAEKIPVSSTKSMIGHTLAASGAIEAIACIKSIQCGIITPTINISEPDPELDLDYVPEKPRNQILKNILSNSFGFGGHNSSLIFSEYH